MLMSEPGLGLRVWRRLERGLRDRLVALDEDA